MSVAAILTMLSVSYPAWGAVVFETRILTGDPAPGSNGEFVFSGFNDPAFDGMGRLVLGAWLTNEITGETTIYCIVRQGPDGLEMVAQEGTAVSGTGGSLIYSEISALILNPAGRVVFQAELTGPDTTENNDTAMVAGMPGALSIIAREGDAIPGAGDDSVIGDLSDVHPNLNNSGQVAFVCPVTGPAVDETNDRAVFLVDSGMVTQVIRKGDALAGVESGTTIADLGAIATTLPRLGNDGHVTFFARLTGPAINSDNDACVLTYQSGALTILARTGMAAPGTEAGTVFNSLAIPAENASGRVCLYASLRGPGVTDFLNERAIFSNESGSFTPFVRGGQHAPGLESGTLLWSQSTPGINSDGRVVFSESLMGPDVTTSNRYCVYSDAAGTLQSIARAGDRPPGADVGVVFKSFAAAPAIGHTGQIVFSSSVVGGDLPQSGSRGLWATDPDGILHLIALAGVPFDVNDDPMIVDMRTVTYVDYANGGSKDGRLCAFNEEGQLAVAIGFADELRGVFVAKLNEAPQCPCLGDVNGDGRIDGLDIDGFIRCLLNSAGSECACADITGNSLIDAADTDAFVQALKNNAQCE